MPNVEETTVIPKKEAFRDASPDSSIDSSAEIDGEGEAEGNVDPAPAAPPKRKGGRKPIYATSEERKQRNRQAQAAFRERRTEYIKQLEAKIQQHEQSLQQLQQSHRTAADECLMLRYKNSLLERILVEKGIDVQAELRRKEIAPPSRLPQNLPQPSPIGRGMRARHLSRLSSGTGSMVGKSMQSPGAMSGTSSQVSSPIKSPGFSTGGMSMPYQSPQSIQSASSRSGTGRTGLQPIAPNPPPGHWPSPFQSHNEQLEQEYGSHADMIDADEQPEEIGPGPYPQSYTTQAYSMGPPGFAIPVTSSDDMAQHASVGHGYNGGDSMVDSDIFGLSASMHFPTPFTYQESAPRK